MSRQPAFLGILLALTLFASACSGSDPTPEATVSTADPTATADVAAPESAEFPVDEESPLEVLIGVPVFDEDAMNDWFRDLSVQAERLTAECMLGEGFDYTPELIPGPSQADGDVARGTRDYAERYGFGAVAAFNEAEYDATKDYSTPNSRYLASLSDPEADAYFTALTGSTRDAELSSDEFIGGGCEGQAFDEVSNVLGVMDQFGPAVETYYELFIADNRVIALNEQWQACMADAGYSVSDPDRLSDEIYRDMDEIFSAGDAFVDQTLPTDLPERPDVFNGDVHSYHPKLTDEAQVRLDEVQADEIALAVRNWDCRDEILDEELKVQREYEQRIVDEIGPQVAAALQD